MSTANQHPHRLPSSELGWPWIISTLNDNKLQLNSPYSIAILIWWSVLDRIWYYMRQLKTKTQSVVAYRWQIGRGLIFLLMQHFQWNIRGFSPKVVHTVVVRPGASEYSNFTSSVYHYFYVFFQLTISLSNRSDTINHGETLRTTWKY